jgi:prephenate dehydrogenase
MKKLTIIGLGLIGSSVARGLKGKYHITAYNRNNDIAKKALKDGVIDKAAKELSDAVSDADIVMICTPIRFYESIMNEISEYVHPGCIITDVGSVKTATLQRIYNHLPPGVHFIPAHPIAGKETAGYEAGEAKLFLGKKTILTPLPKAKLEAVLEIENLWKDLGAHTERMTPAEHDKIYAAVSHAPQLLAYAFKMALKHKKYALQTEPTGDLKTALRISNSSPDIWVDIFMLNRTHIFSFLEKIFAGLLHIDKFADQVELRQRLGGSPKEFKLSKDPKYDAACIFASLLGNLTIFCADDEFERGSVSRKFSAADIHQSLAMLDEPMKPEDRKHFQDYSGSGLRDFTAYSLYDVSDHISDFEQEIAILRALVHRKIFEITAAVESDSVELLGQKLSE